MGTYCFGIDVGGTTIKCGLFRSDGTLLDKWEIPTRLENRGEEILPDAARSILLKLQEKGISSAEVTGVGVGIPGPVNEEGEVSCAVNLSWEHKAVARELSQLTGMPAKAGNDANVAALGEAWKGAAEGAKDVILITLGTGVGGGIIVNGRIVSGHHGAAGEVGHASLDRHEKEFCNCGNRGCLEQTTSATGIVRVARRELEACTEESVLRSLSQITARDVLDAFKAGDALSVRVMEKVCRRLGSALAVFSCVTDPEFIVIGGGVSRAGEPLLDCIRKYFREYAFPPCRNTPIVLASLGNDAGIYGAARMVLQK